VADKPVLVQLDEDVWKAAKVRASVMGMTVSAFTQQALANHLTATATVEKKALASYAESTANYVSPSAAVASSSLTRKKSR
jgi:hypothetical protein